MFSPLQILWGPKAFPDQTGHIILPQSYGSAHGLRNPPDRGVQEEPDAQSTSAERDAEKDKSPSPCGGAAGLF